MGPGHDLPRSLEFMYAVRARFSASSIRAAMRAVPFFLDVTMWKPFVRRRDFPFSPSIESIERNREEITDRDRSRLAEKSINFRSKRRKKKSRNIYVDRSSKSFSQFGGRKRRSLDLPSFLRQLLLRSHDFHLGSHRRTCAYASL